MATGIAFGIKGSVSRDMTSFVTEITPNGNPIMDINTVLSRLEIAGKFIAQAGSKPILYATDSRFENALKAFNSATLVPSIFKRFVPGTLTNTELKYYQDAGILIVSDPSNGVPTKIGQVPTGDARAIQEASTQGIPIVAICNTNASLKDVDFCIPANNVGPRAIATTFYLLARSILLATGYLKSSGGDLCSYVYKEPLSINDFETAPQVQEGSEEVE